MTSPSGESVPATGESASRTDADAPSRLFAAIDIPEPVRTALEAWGSRELTDPALRPVPAASLHMTLCFLGRTEAAKVGEAVAAVEAVEPVPTAVRFERMPAGRPRRLPKVLAIEASSRAAVRLQAELSASLVDAGLLFREPRPYWPHVTVARVRTESGGRRPTRIEMGPGPLPESLTAPFDAVRVSLYRSTLRPEGAEYVPLAQKDLPSTA